MLGLKRHVVHLADHDSRWAAAFDAEATSLRSVLRDLAVDIQHVGSTAVPGMVAKPILDIALAVSSRHSIPRVVRRLVANGFIERGNSGSEGGYLVVRESEPDVRVVHVHIVERSDPQFRTYLTFRDALCHDSHLRVEYSALKRQLAEAHKTDRRAYTEGKKQFIAQVLNRIGV